MRVMESVGIETNVWTFRVANGYGEIKRKVPEYAVLARNQPVVLFTDLDNARCPTALIQGWLGRTVRPSQLLIRVATQSVESWLLADRRNIAKFLAVSEATIPRAPDSEPNAKLALLKACRKSRSRRRREAMVADGGSYLRQAISYTAELTDFVREYWDITRAEESSPSLRRTRSRLAASWPRHEPSESPL